MANLTPNELALELAREDQKLILGLVARRKEINFSHQDMVEKTGMTKEEVISVEKIGEDLHMSTVRRYARVLGVMVTHDTTIA